jgi:uncharacterized C2H2 Zn-finger protein
MSFTCEKCDKTFDRKIDLERHVNRKTPCYTELKCERCFKSFLRLSNYKQHMNRKTPCYNKHEELLLMLQIKDKELQIEKAKTNQARIKLENAKQEKLFNPANPISQYMGMFEGNPHLKLED